MTTTKTIETAIKRLSMYDIYAQAECSCYTNHFSKDVTDSDLIHRTLNAPRNIPGASVFTADENVVLQAIQETLMDYSEWITEWLNDYSDREELFCESEVDTVLGKGFYKKSWHNWNKAGAAQLHKICVVLRKSDNANGYRIHTCYPEFTAEDIERCKLAAAM